MKSRFRAFLALAISALFALLLLEGLCQINCRLRHGKWYPQIRRESSGMLQQHPYFGACLTPNISVERNGIRITHNSFRCRNAEFARPKPAGLRRIAALGGSSTYCVLVSDDQTWERHLNEQLGTNSEVINMGAPGGTSIETMAQTALLFSDVQPDIALYYLGWNDAQVQHVQNLWPDWSDSHGKLLLGQVFRSEDYDQRTATGYYLRRILSHIWFPHRDDALIKRDLKPDQDAFTDRLDLRALALYERNLRNIIALCRTQKVEPVFIPQILNYAVLTSDKPYGWIPFVRDRDLKKVMAGYNEIMAKVAKEENVTFIKGVLDVDFQAADFVDNGHFSPAGNRRFAEVLARALTPPQKPHASTP